MMSSTRSQRPAQFSHDEAPLGSLLSWLDEVFYSAPTTFLIRPWWVQVRELPIRP